MTIELPADKLKEFIDSNRFEVTNLKLTSDNRLVDAVKADGNTLPSSKEYWRLFSRAKNISNNEELLEYFEKLAVTINKMSDTVLYDFETWCEKQLNRLDGSNFAEQFSIYWVTPKNKLKAGEVIKPTKKVFKNYDMYYCIGGLVILAGKECFNTLVKPDLTPMDIFRLASTSKVFNPIVISDLALKAHLTELTPTTNDGELDSVYILKDQLIAQCRKSMGI